MQTLFLSKSLFQSGRQCRKRLWLEVHRRELKTPDAVALLRIDEGIRLGEIAREHFGSEVGEERVAVTDSDFDIALAQTLRLLSEPPTHRPVLFEAAFEHDGVRIRVDVLMRFPLAHRLIEVKAGTEPKEDYFWDCAIQTWVMRGAGRAVQTISLALVEKEFVLGGDGDHRGLLAVDDCTEQVEALLPQVPNFVAEFKEVVAGTQPERSTGKHCNSPYECPFLKHCQTTDPPSSPYPLEDLPRATAPLLARLRQAGFSDLSEVSLEHLTNPKHRRVAKAVQTAEAFVSPEFAQVLDGLGFPRYYLDFETIAFAIPRWVGTRPHQQVAFQFSCHVEYADGTLTHREFLDLSGSDPSTKFVAALMEAIGKSGPVVVWNKSFEIGRLRELSARFPDNAPALLSIVERVVDLLEVYRGHYYHRDMHGSWSIKKVLPTVAPDLDYTGLDVFDGDMAQVAYRRAIASGTTDEDREAIRRSLQSYCGLDTLAMVRLARWRPA